MIFNFNSITLSFLVVASVTLAVVVVLVWYVYSSKKFKNDILDLMDEKFEILLLGEKKEAEEPATEEEPHDFEVDTKPTETAEEQEDNDTETPEEQQEVTEEHEEPQSFEEKPHE